MKKTKKMTKSKYSQISNLNELETAQKRLKKKLRRKEQKIGDRIYGLRDDYSALHLFGMTMRSAHADGLLLKGIRFLKKNISKL